MPEKTLQFNFRLSQEDYERLCRNAEKAGYTQSMYLRSLINNFVPKPLPDERFFIAMNRLTNLCDSMSRIARKAEAIGDVDAEHYKTEAEELLDFKLEVRRHYILPDKIK